MALENLNPIDNPRRRNKDKIFVATYCSIIDWAHNELAERKLPFSFSFSFCSPDALGLAAFCVVGVQAAAKRGLAPTLWVISGLMTATFGGIIRDVICGDPPRIMYPHRTLYALGPALGALTYTILDNLATRQSLTLNTSSITLISFLVAFAVRVLSFNKPWRMPHWNVQQS